MENQVLFRHYIITRFNIKFSGTKNKQLSSIDISQDEDYLLKRFDLFDKYLYPSLKSQTNKNFDWLVFFDINTPEKYKKLIDEYEKGFDNFKAVYIDESCEFQQTCDELFATSGAEYIVTTRIDNDDAVSERFVEYIQNIINEKGTGSYAFGFQNGIQYDIERKIASNYAFPLNHFTTLIAPFDVSTKTIYAYNHTKIEEFVDFNNVVLELPMWLEIVHGTNVSNRMHTKLKDVIRDVNPIERMFHCEMPVVLGFKNYIYIVFIKLINGLRLFKTYSFRTFIRKAIHKIRYGYGE